MLKGRSPSSLPGSVNTLSTRESGGPLRISATPTSSSNTATLSGDKMPTETLHSIQEIASGSPPKPLRVEERLPKESKTKVVGEKKDTNERNISDKTLKKPRKIFLYF